MQNRRNFYRVLQVQPDAPEAVIKASYRTLMQKLKAHPDLGGDSEKASLLNQAYEVLLNPDKRALYDNQLFEQYQKSELSGTIKFSGNKNAIIQCVFCENQIKIEKQNSDYCQECGCPLHHDKHTGSDAEKQSAHDFMKLDNQGKFQCFAKPNQPGKVIEPVSLSPVGMCFLSDNLIPSDSIIKIEGQLLTACARIQKCVAWHQQGCPQFQVEASFVTLKFKRPSGNFVRVSV